GPDEHDGNGVCGGESKVARRPQGGGSGPGPPQGGVGEIRHHRISKTLKTCLRHAHRSSDAQAQRGKLMIEKVIEYSVRNRFLVMILAAALTACAIYAVINTPVDAI